MAVLLLLTCIRAGEVAGQQALQVFPLGTEFRVNSYTTNMQSEPRVASDVDGDFIVVWESQLQDGDAAGIFAQRFASNGTVVGTEFQVNTYTTDKQEHPAVAMDADGDLVVVWEDYTLDGDVTGSFGRRFASSGAPLGTEFRVNEITTSLQNDPVVFSEPDGDFVVVWNNPDVPFYIQGRRFNSAGAPLGTDFEIAFHDPENLYYPEIAGGKDGRFMVVWSCQDLTPEFDTCARRYDSSGTPLGTEFVVNTITAGPQYPAAIAATPRGDFMVAWNNTDNYLSIGAQRYASNGGAQGTEFQVNTTAIPNETHPSVAADRLGFTVVWENDPVGPIEIFGQRYHSNGNPLGTEFLVSSYTTGDARLPSVSADTEGDFVVVWEETSGQDGALSGIFGQRYVMAYEVDSQTVGPGGSFGTDVGEGDGATFADITETTVTTPSGGPVSVIERPWNDTVPPPSGFGFAGQQVVVEAPSETPGTPLQIVFEIKARGQIASAIQVYRNGTLVQNCAGVVMGCVGTLPTTANPDPCVAKRCTLPDGDIELTVLTSAASTWDFAGPCVSGFAKGLLLVKENVPGEEKLTAKLIQGPAGVQDDFGNPLVADGTPYRLRLYDDTGTQVGEALVSRAGDLDCSGGTTACWKAMGGAPPTGKGYKYKDGDTAADGVFKILMKTSPSGTKILLKAKGPAPPFPAGLASALQSTSSVTVQFHNDDAVAPYCFSTTLSDIKTQDPDKFKAK
jgi:hypothetical protein